MSKEDVIIAGQCPLSRRSFLQGLAAGAGAAALGPALPTPSLAAPQPATTIARVRHRYVLKKGHVVDGDIVRQMVGRAMADLTGMAAVEAQWKRLFGPQDRVAIKINCLGAPMNTHPEVVQAVQAGLRAAGVRPDNILIWDRVKEHLEGAGYTLGVREGVRTTHNGEWGYGQSLSHGSGRASFCALLDQVTAVVSVPVLKDHDLMGLTCALKNLSHGAVEAAERWHFPGGEQIPDLYGVPPIRSKVRLIVADGLQAMYKGGPFDSPHKYAHRAIYAALDPVALDQVVLDTLNAKRTKLGLRPIRGDYLNKAAKLGLGVADRARINLVKVDLAT